jgi:hypothetical protein
MASSTRIFASGRYDAPVPGRGLLTASTAAGPINALDMARKKHLLWSRLDRGGAYHVQWWKLLARRRCDGSVSASSSSRSAWGRAPP